MVKTPPPMPIERHQSGDMTLRIRLIRKLAERLNGVDLSKVRVGDSLDLSSRDARILIAEGWAELLELRSGNTEQARE
jgi:flagellar biosynthesis component FlhA